MYIWLFGYKMIWKNDFGVMFMSEVMKVFDNVFEFVVLMEKDGFIVSVCLVFSFGVWFEMCEIIGFMVFIGIYDYFLFDDVCVVCVIESLLGFDVVVKY